MVVLKEVALQEFSAIFEDSSWQSAVKVMNSYILERSNVIESRQGTVWADLISVTMLPLRHESRHSRDFLLYRFFFSKPSSIVIFYESPNPKWFRGWIQLYGTLRTQARDYPFRC